MKIFISFVFILILFSFAKYSYSQNENRWVFLDIGADGRYGYYDPSSVKYNDDSYVFWLKFTNVPLNDVETILEYERIYCKENKYIVTENVIYYTDKTLKRESFPYGEYKKNIIPDSFADGFYNLLCK